MPLPQEKLHTIEDIYNLPDGKRAELIDGQIYYMAPPIPDKNRIMVHDLQNEDIGDYTFSDTIKAEIYDDLSIDFSKLNI